MSYNPVDSVVVAGGTTPALIFTEDDVLSVDDYSAVPTGHRTFTLRSRGVPVPLTACRMTSDVDGEELLASGTTSASGRVTFAHKLAPGTVVFVQAAVNGAAVAHRLVI